MLWGSNYLSFFFCSGRNKKKSLGITFDWCQRKSEFASCLLLKKKTTNLYVRLYRRWSWNDPGPCSPFFSSICSEFSCRWNARNCHPRSWSLHPLSLYIYTFCITAWFFRSDFLGKFCTWTAAPCCLLTRCYYCCSILLLPIFLYCVQWRWPTQTHASIHLACSDVQLLSENYYAHVLCIQGDFCTHYVYVSYTNESRLLHNHIPINVCN